MMRKGMVAVLLGFVLIGMTGGPVDAQPRKRAPVKGKPVPRKPSKPVSRAFLAYKSTIKKLSLSPVKSALSNLEKGPDSGSTYTANLVALIKAAEVVNRKAAAKYPSSDAGTKEADAAFKSSTASLERSTKQFNAYRQKGMSKATLCRQIGQNGIVSTQGYQQILVYKLDNCQTGSKAECKCSPITSCPPQPFAG